MKHSEQPIRPNLSWMISHKAFYALGFGTGLAPKMPGTIGSLPGLYLAWLAQDLFWPWQVALALFLFAYGVYVSDKTAKALGEHDHQSIVCDEIAGMYLVALTLPVNIVNLLLAFLAFRLFDITKPWPIRWVDARVPGGWGIMLDDILAALPAMALVHSILYLMP